MRRAFMMLFAVLQGLLAARVALRMVATPGGSTIRRQTGALEASGDVTVLVPVLNEVGRLAPCLDGLMLQGAEVREILVIDGGSSDGTQDLVDRFAGRDERIRLVDAAPVPELVNGKAHGLAAGMAEADPEVRWILTIDADVRPKPGLVQSLLAHARQEGVRALSVATRQRLSGAAEGVVHPSMLATLVYRHGIPGGATTRLDLTQANGQCFLMRREVLDAVGGFPAVTRSICEDVHLARNIARRGEPIGFYESDNLVTVEMYAGWRDAWTNWARSLPMLDGQPVWRSRLGLAEIALVQAAPLAQAVIGTLVVGPRHPLTRMGIGLLMMRFGVLAGMSRAYEQRPWTYWLSPLADLPVVMRIAYMGTRRRHTWRGRDLVDGENR